MKKNWATRPVGTAFTLELGRTLCVAWDGEEPYVAELATVMELHMGTMTTVAFANADKSEEGDDPDGLFAALDFLDHDEPRLGTLTVPDQSVLTDSALARLQVPSGMRVVRRQVGTALHPVHTAAINVLLWGSDDPGVLDAEQFLNRLDESHDEVFYYSLYEHTFDIVGGVGYLPVATYRQPRDGEVDDPHASHGFDPWCCGVARLQALQTTPHLTPAHRQGRTGRTDASNGA